MTVPWDIPADAEICWLLQQGISEKAMLQPPHIRAANVTFLDRHTFDFEASGVRAFVFKVEDCGHEIDTVAWSAKLGCLATWHGVAFALGQDAITNPATYFAGGVLRIHRTPLEWLRAERNGLVIVQPKYAHAHLRDARMSCADPELARQLEGWIQLPQPRAEIFVEIAERAAA